MKRTTWTTLGLAVTAVGFAFVTPTGVDASTNHARQSKIELGRRLFLDPTVSGGGKFSCSSCHEPEHGFSDPRQFSEDENGVTARHSQPVVALGGEGFHWDGEFQTVDQLLFARLASPRAAMDQSRDLINAHFKASTDAGLQPDVEQHRRRIQSLAPPYYGPVTPSGPGVRPTAIALRVDLDDRYSDGFRRAYGSAKVTTDRMVEAMGAYLANLTHTESPWDRHLRGDSKALTEEQERGREIFEGKAGCNSCHVTDGDNGTVLTDGRFHNTGVAYRVTHREFDPLARSATAKPTDAGRSNMTFASAHDGSFKTPSLRDVALRPPYMHDGSFATLREVVDYYAGGGTESPHLSRHVKPIDLDERERDDLIAFLHALTGDERAGLGPTPKYRPDQTRIKIVDMKGKELPDFPVTIRPAGDRLQGTESMPESFEAMTNEWGFLKFEFPASTHVVLEAEGMEIALSRLIPDSVRKLEVMAVPTDLVAVKVRLHDEDLDLPDAIVLRPVLENGTTTDAEFSLGAIHKIDRRTALYGISREDLANELAWSVGARDLWRMFVSVGDRNVGQREFDLRGGESEPIDLRAAPPDTRRRGNSAGRDLDDRRRRRPNAGGGEGGDGSPTPRPKARDTVGDRGAVDR